MSVAACYVRVSTENQKENYSIEEQKSRLRAFCKAKDIVIGKMYVDGGYSGGNLRRPALQELLRRLPEYDLVIVYKLDRLSRSQKDTLMLIEDYFLARKVDFISVCENFDTSTPLGRAMIGMLSVFAQLEKEQITERFTMGRIARAKNGYYHGGPTAPVGYDYVDGRLIVNEKKARQVRELFERFCRGASIHDCWLHMQARYGASGGWSSETQIRHVLVNEVYLGKVKFQGESYPGLHPPVIPEELFSRAQALLQERKSSLSAGSRPFAPRTLLSGLLICGQCGARFHGEHGWYVCGGRRKRRREKIAASTEPQTGPEPAGADWRPACTLPGEDRAGQAEPTGASREPADASACEDWAGQAEPTGARREPADTPACGNRKWRIPELDALVIDTLCQLRFEAPPGNVPDGAATEPMRTAESVSGRAATVHAAGFMANTAAPTGPVDFTPTAAAPKKDAGQQSMFTANALLRHLLLFGDLPDRRACLALLIRRICLDGDRVTLILQDIL